MSARPLFRDRDDAGRRLASALAHLKGRDALVLGIPRGGVPVAAQVARAIEGELDVTVAKKVGAPAQPELALGAVTAQGGLFLNEDLLRALACTPDSLRPAIEEKLREARELERSLRGSRPQIDARGRTVVVVDDGLATGATMRAVVRGLREQEPAHLVVAVPVGAQETCAALAREADELICLEQPRPFLAVGHHYTEFGQTSESAVLALLEQAANR